MLLSSQGTDPARLQMVFLGDACVEKLANASARVVQTRSSPVLVRTVFAAWSAREVAAKVRSAARIVSSLCGVRQCVFSQHC